MTDNREEIASIRANLDELNQAVAQELERAKAQGRPAWTGGSHWAAGVLVQDLRRLEAEQGNAPRRPAPPGRPGKG